MKRQEVLQEAANLIAGDRQEDYGDAMSSFVSIAEAWSWYLGYHITPVDVGQMMTLLKISRSKTGEDFKADSYIDACGYQALAAEIHSNFFKVLKEK